MADERVPYTKVGDEYVFTLKDAEGIVTTSRVKITSGERGEEDKIGNDVIALFPDRSSNHKRIKAFIEAERAKQPVVEAIDPGK
jgi:hypothetical protein